MIRSFAKGQFIWVNVHYTKLSSYDRDWVPAKYIEPDGTTFHKVLILPIRRDKLSAYEKLVPDHAIKTKAQKNLEKVEEVFKS